MAVAQVPDVSLIVRVDLGPHGRLGPGKMLLLDNIDQLGSISAAGRAMSMSYRHAWLLVQAVEDTFGAPVITTATGGAKGGGAKLTDLGKTVIARYRSIEAQATRAAAGELTELSKAAHGALPDERAGKRRERGSH